ncbi:mechanosensitive ion channel family protein [Pedobacter duraquae]|uniref:Small conductance mechanosensitive channel n=1 Tax=Pedobacter duraquae TaxID=425511 RepID=A0A4R6IHK6_9SPHI|nr:mechanosensitive ion channel family protein [Pedobacter duraquae]TDO20635.1 small conductance mechanosensitive channel [Pedobacter duraquae]
MKLNSAQVDKFYDKVYNWLIIAVPNIIVAILILAIGLWVIKLVSKWLHSGLNKHEIDPSLKPFFISLTIIGLRILLVIAIMPIIGIEMTVFSVLVGGLGVAAGLALSGTLQNFASGVLILILKPFRVGDNIIAQGQEGTVTSIEIFYTIVTTFDNRTVVIPNSKLSNEVIINISMQGSRRLDIELKFSYGVDFEEVKKIITETITESKNLLKTPERRIGIATLEESGYKVSIAVWLKAHGYRDAQLAFQEKLMSKLKSGTIKLPGMDAS